MKKRINIVLPDSILDGALCEAVRKFHSGYWTVKMLEDRGAYKKGDELTLSPGEWKIVL
jgi:hypothetical protein